jgi:thiamine pyrophosphate-dependent acetolactate synthase large subunit-like protein
MSRALRVLFDSRCRIAVKMGSRISCVNGIFNVKFGLDYANPDFVTYAQSFGAHGYRIQTDAHFQQTLDTCLTRSGVHLIELPVDYSLNHEILNVLLKEKTCQL